MIALNLTASGTEQTAIKEYLQNSASEILAEKINNGVRILKDGIPLMSKKNLDGFMKYACDEAKKLAEKGANSACVRSDTVFNWAIHYFEEDSIEGILYNEDGTEFNPPKPKYEPKVTVIPVTRPKPQTKPQLSLFDMLEDSDNKKPVETAIEISAENIETDDDDDGFTEEEQQEIMQEISRQEAEENEQKLQEKLEPSKGSPLYQRYSQLQQQFPDSIIAMRLGDFYEVFGGSAVLLAKELDLTLTGRNCGLESRVPMVGFPYHAAENYIRKISEKHKIIVAESIDNFKVFVHAEQELDSETYDVLTEEEMRKFDGDIEEPKELLTNSSIEKSTVTAPKNTIDNKIFNKLSELLGNILIAR